MPDAGYSTIQVGGHHVDSKRYDALVDNADAEAISAYRWSMAKGYAARQVRVEGKRLGVLIHREILGFGPGDPDVDHINGNKLDNRRANLRPCTMAQNKQNLHERPYRGTHWNAERNLWIAQAGPEGTNRYLGSFATREEAAAVVTAWRRQHMPFSADARDEYKPPKRPER